MTTKKEECSYLTKMDCPKCNAKLRKASVSVEGTSRKAVSYQCGNCDFFTFERVSAQKVLKELREMDFITVENGLHLTDAGRIARL